MADPLVGLDTRMWTDKDTCFVTLFGFLAVFGLGVMAWTWPSKPFKHCDTCVCKGHR